jgi:hypothetical protein
MIRESNPLLDRISVVVHDEEQRYTAHVIDQEGDHVVLTKATCGTDSGTFLLKFKGGMVEVPFYVVEDMLRAFDRI